MLSLRHGLAALASCGLLAIAIPSGYASQINLEEELLKRLKESGADKKIFNSPGYVAKSLKIKGDVELTKFHVAKPKEIPDKVDVLGDNEYTNCTPDPVPYTPRVQKSFTNSATFTMSKTFSSTTQISGSVNAPLIGKINASESLQFSGTKTTQTVNSETLTFGDGPGVTVRPNSKYTLRFSLSYKSLENIPWSAKFEVRGPIEVTFEPSRDAIVCVYDQPNFKGKHMCKQTQKELELDWLYSHSWDNSKHGSPNKNIRSLHIRGSADVYFSEERKLGGDKTHYDSDQMDIPARTGHQFKSMKIVPKANTESKTISIEKYLGKEMRHFQLSGHFEGKTANPHGDWYQDEQVFGSHTDCVKSKNIHHSSSPKETITLRHHRPIKGKIIKSGVKPIRITDHRRHE